MIRKVSCSFSLSAKNRNPYGFLPRINEALQWARGKNGSAKSGDETRRRATFVARLVPRSSFRASFFGSRLTDCCSLSIRDFFLIFRARFFYIYIFLWGSKRAAFLPAMVSTLVANCEVRESLVWLCKVQTFYWIYSYQHIPEPVDSGRLFCSCKMSAQIHQPHCYFHEQGTICKSRTAKFTFCFPHTTKLLK